MRAAHSAIVVAFALAAGVSAQDAAPSLTNAGFEAPFHVLVPDATAAGQIAGEIAAGWIDNSGWAPCAVTYAIERDDPYRGATAQVMTIDQVAGGSVQLIQNVAFRAGQGLRFSIAMRGQPGQRITLALRQRNEPWISHASVGCTLTAEWRRYHVQGVTPHDEDGLVVIRAEAPMRVALDDARLEDLDAIVVDAPPRIGNQVPGGSFATATLPFGWSVMRRGDPDVAWNDPRARCAEGGRNGTQGLRVDLDAGGYAQVRSPLLTPTGNRDHAASIWLRAEGGPVGIALVLPGTPLRHATAIGDTWTRVVAADRIPLVDWTHLRIEIRAPDDRPATLWLDDAMFEERATPSPEVLPHAAHELALSLDRPGHVLHGDETAMAQLTIAPPPPAGAVLRREVVDLLGSTQSLPDVPDVAPTAQLDLPNPSGRTRGLFKLRLRLHDAAGLPLSAPAELVWARLPTPRELPARDSAFGIHVPLSPRGIALARATGNRWVRLHDTSMIAKWPVAEPEPGRWRFYDQQVDAAITGGLAILGMLDGAPQRVSTVSREGDYWSIWHVPNRPGADQAWRHYVATVVAHYRGRIDHWEVWNEPWGEWWQGVGGTPAGYAALLRDAHAAATAANPAVTLVGIDSYRGRDWHHAVLALIGTTAFDVFSFHDYHDSLAGGEPDRAVIQAQNFIAAQREHGEPRPLWCTEGGLTDVGSWYASATGGMAPRTQVAYAIRNDVTQLAAGVRRHLLYAAHADPAMGEANTRLTEYDGAVKPLLAARAVLAALVDGLGPPQRLPAPTGIDRFGFAPDPQSGGRRVEVWWAHDGATHHLAVPQGATLLNALGDPLDGAGAQVPLTAEPLFLLVNS